MVKRQGVCAFSRRELYTTSSLLVGSRLGTTIQLSSISSMKDCRLRTLTYTYTSDRRACSFNVRSSTIKENTTWMIHSQVCLHLPTKIPDHPDGKLPAPVEVVAGDDKYWLMIPASAQVECREIEGIVHQMPIEQNLQCNQFE